MKGKTAVRRENRVGPSKLNRVSKVTKPASQSYASMCALTCMHEGRPRLHA